MTAQQMSERAFLAKLAEISNVPEQDLHESTEITPSAWDSVDVLDLIAAIDDAYGVTVEMKRLMTCRTVGDLRTLIRSAGIQT